MEDEGSSHDFAPRGVVFHHTASNRHSGPCPSLGTVVKGRPVDDGTFVFGPLCHILARDGVVYLVAAGRASHAGFGGPWRNIPMDSANMYTVGVEVENDGDEEPWSLELLEVCDVVFATLLIGLRRREFPFGHKEWAPHRKMDPARISMDEYRQKVARVIKQIKWSQLPPVPPSSVDIYVVKPGDTVFSIATRHGMSVQELIGINRLTATVIPPCP